MHSETTSTFVRTVAPRLGLALTALGWLLTAAPASALTLQGDAAAAFTATPLAEGVGQPTDVAVLPDGRAVIILRNGDIITVLANKTEVAEHINVDNGQDEQGLLGVVADPNFATNQYLYFYASAAGADQANRHQVHRYKLDAESKLTEMKVLVDMGLRGPANHNGGGLDFYDGALYVSVGDTGNNNTPPTNKFGTCLNIANGKILRVSPETGMPIADNPLMALDMVTGCDSVNGALGMRAPDKRIFAWGFRNPFRFHVDKQTGKLWVGDVGEGAREEVAVGDGGRHYGWPFFEGTVKYNEPWMGNDCQGVTPATACVPTAYEYDHGGAKDCIIGGVILDGCEWAEPWKSRYIFGDHGSGEIWTLDVNAARDGVVPNSLKPFATSPSMASFRMGADNSLYVVEDQGGGTVHRVTLNGAPTNMDGCAVSVGGSGGGGAGGASGAPSTAGANAAGGASASGGAPAVGGSAAASAGKAGAATSAGGAGNGAASADKGGCGCRAAGAGSGSSLGFGALAAALALMVQRRRRSARS